MWHDGNIPGVNTELGFLPSDGLGFAIIINSDITDDQQISIGNQIITNFIAANSTSSTFTTTADLSARDTLAGGPVSQRLSLTRRSPHSIPVNRFISHRDSNSSSSIARSLDFSGTYYNRGYGGNITLCSASSSSSDCLDLLSNFSAVDAVSSSGLNASDPEAYELVANWGKLFAPQIRIVPTGVESTDGIGNTTVEATIIATSLFPQGYGANTTAFEEELGSADVTFVVSTGNGSDASESVLGFALSGTEDEENDRQREGGSVEYVADAWFVKL